MATRTIALLHDMAKANLDRHAAHAVVSYIAGMLQRLTWHSDVRHHPDGIRARAGYQQRTLEALIAPLLASGMNLVSFREDADAPTPDLIGLLAVRA